MLCRECHKRPVAPVVAWDIDGTMANYHETFTEMACRYWNIPQPPDTWDGSGEMEDYLCLTKEQYREAKLAYRQGGYKRSLPMYPYGARAVNDTRDMGAEVWVCTTRPWQRLDNIDPDTREWCRRHRIEFDGLLYGERKYHQLIESVHPDRIVGVIDDLVEYLDDAESLGLPTFQVVRPHNRSAEARWHTRGTLHEATDWVEENIKRWREKYG